MLICLVFVWQLLAVSTVSEFVNMEQIGHRYMIGTILSFGKSSSPNQYQSQPGKILNVSVSSLTPVKYQIAEFKRAHTSCQGEHYSGRTNEVPAPEMVKKIHKMVLS